MYAIKVPRDKEPKILILLPCSITRISNDDIQDYVVYFVTSLKNAFLIAQQLDITDPEIKEISGHDFAPGAHRADW